MVMLSRAQRARTKSRRSNHNSRETLQMKVTTESLADHVWSNPVVEEFRLFHTPQDWDEIMEWIHLHPVEDRAHIVTAACMAWNLAARRLATTMSN